MYLRCRPRLLRIVPWPLPHSLELPASTQRRLSGDRPVERVSHTGKATRPDRRARIGGQTVCSDGKPRASLQVATKSMNGKGYS